MSPQYIIPIPKILVEGGTPAEWEAYIPGTAAVLERLYGPRKFGKHGRGGRRNRRRRDGRGARAQGAAGK